MIEGKTIICFASGYDAPPTSKHHVMHLLAENNVVLWVNYHASRTPSASASDLSYMAAKLKQIISGMKQPRKNLFVLTPLVIPLPSSQFARRLNRFILITQIRLALNRIKSRRLKNVQFCSSSRKTKNLTTGIQRVFRGIKFESDAEIGQKGMFCKGPEPGPIQIWSFTPDIAYVLGHFNEEKVIYYCVDDHASFSGYDKAQVLADEKELSEKSDLVITTSMALQEAKSPWNANTILLPHGVDYDHFSRAVHEDLPCPEDLALIPKPRLGFFGLIRDWVDVDLMASVAEKKPEWHLVIIGDADSSVDLEKYRKIPNLHFLGRKPYQDLPAYCRHLDAGLIPFKINDLTIAVNPIKLREYLAAGLPVISTPLPEVSLYKNLVDIANSPDEFIASFEKHIGELESNRIERSKVMEVESWPYKVETIYQTLLSS